MMKMNQDKFFAEFVQRTRKNYELLKSESTYDVTALVNSTIGLLVVPKEENINVTSGCELEKVLNEMKNYIVPPYDSNQNMAPKKIIQHMRNAVAHANISFVGECPSLKSEPQVVKSIRFKDFYPPFGKEKKQNFEIVLEIKVLEKFLYALSDQYLAQKN